jgi:hypothetical protein
MADQYQYEKCGKTSTAPGNCCGAPMKKVREMRSPRTL